MISEAITAFVWIWLPDAVEPVVCGRLDSDRSPITFTYGQRYLERADAVPIFERELPLRTGPQTTASGSRLPLCIDDAMPDAWGRKLIQHRLCEPTSEFTELTYLLKSGSNRIGALDFQLSATKYLARSAEPPSLNDLAEAAEAIETGQPIDERLDAALLHGTSIGGARPKALLSDGDRQLIAKFTTSTDTFLWVQAEYVAMDLARRAGLDVAAVEFTRAGGRAALLVERFDRSPGGHRRRMVSALTVLGFNTFPDGRYATYSAIAHAIRDQFVHPDATLRELFARISFNILCGNTDDHGRNHAAFVRSDGLALTPAYDISPQPRSGNTARQALAFTNDIENRDARLANLLSAAAVYHLTKDQAGGIIDHQTHVIRDHWDEVCDAAELTGIQRDALMGRQFLNRHAFEK
jgi:serine/threonine-protein kinase HipA